MKNVFLACAAGGVFGVCFSLVFGKVGVSTARKLNRGKKTMREGGGEKAVSLVPHASPFLCLPQFSFPAAVTLTL